MASYHRVLRTFDRSIDDKIIECDYDIHPWDILIDNERWPGKIRLIGYIDVFFLICYSGESRFEHGIIIYKDDETIRQLLKMAGLKADDESVKLECINKEKDEALRKYYSLNTEEDGNKHIIASLGHPVGLAIKYRKSQLKKYTISLHKGHTPAMQKEIQRGVMQHGITRLISDALKLGVVSTAGLISKIKGSIVSGSSLETTTTKSINALTATKAHNVVLSADQT
ncbi:uncharacterized protein TrAFT101_010913 [Trichoderma asperellum]|uniref:Uncharacterized protein n=1 Tax=Trichoderma asperellum (strain ATCC 204424 / CBS 433.97 / NBRC 101777) TaxID=1042311 RepID=A0A2T3YX91_TRIA4|nr:hypothetical protein M441DRAFT_61195 [Trichoderma asperellum CBS 433.97]PTB37179.1 hypothetical protein M441DRAFT_61195 [Trichoderma asperellum CBS 433.97]UKZ96111.1 hypothetical protein TrAFT101_010913 [Trichoderma asperellum]